MAIGTATPRDQLDRLIAFVRRALRYWWLVAAIGMVGAALGALLATTAKPKYTSDARIIYNERISSSVLQGRAATLRTRNLGNKYRNMLMARKQLRKVIEEFNLLPDVVAADGIDVAVEELKLQVRFRVHGSGMFHIEYTAHDPDEAQAVTARLTSLLIEEESRLSRENASITKKFLVNTKRERVEELNRALTSLNAFLAEHPEFVLSASGGQAAGASIRAAAEGKSTPDLTDELKETDPQLVALMRQRKRIRASLEAASDDGRSQKTAEQVEAERDVRDARRVVSQAEANLEAKLQQFTALHPDVRQARKQVEAAKQRLQEAQAAVPPDLPKPKIDRNAMARELENIDAQISATQRRLRKEKRGSKPETTEEKPPEEEPENWIVALENEYSRLKIDADQAQNRVEQTDASLSNAEIEMSQKMAEEGAVLSIIDEASRPTRPTGKGPLFLAAAAIMAFLMIGGVLALALALVDDRLYSAGDIDNLNIAPVLVVVPRPARRKWFRRGR